ncbi:hypothetical protein [Pseudomonas matsuisoli]|uniref:Uncharacterized protein n=1 Tax=Pseudomonas matsuisoli TaxID=1515666 RepID=A0A917PY88_9PSED|nr:hypothetical protein [Pseudomonas matsuisoli]GGK00128.1 hypothetical protein GCM10009304_27430 [Pseudomonas matsuisoli]
MNGPKCGDSVCVERVWAGLERKVRLHERKVIRFNDFDAMLPLYAVGALLVAVAMAIAAILAHDVRSPARVASITPNSGHVPIIRSEDVLSVVGDRSGGPAELAQAGKSKEGGRSPVRFVF